MYLGVLHKLYGCLRSLFIDLRREFNLGRRDFMSLTDAFLMYSGIWLMR